MDFAYKSRVRNLQKRLAEKKLDGALITNPQDVLYYTGYKTQTDDQPFVFIGSKKPKILLSPLTGKISGLYADIIFPKKEGLGFLFKGYQKIGFDEHNLSVDVHKKLQKYTKFVPCAETIKKGRWVKDEKEIDCMKKAIALDKKILGNLEFRGSEEQIARKVDGGFFLAHAENAFETIVASGENAGNYIHHFPGTRKVTNKDMIILDYGSKINGYCSDITRTRIPNNKKAKTIFEDVKEIQQAVIDSIVVGMEFKELNELYVELMKKKRYKVFHSIGHGIGLFVHEPAPLLEKNTIITVEPGVYLKNFGGCRIEDMILIGKKIKNLSESIPQVQ